VRGRVAIAINSSWWIGTAAAAGLTVVLLNTLAVNVGWRLGSGLGAMEACGEVYIQTRGLHAERTYPRRVFRPNGV